MQKKQTEIIVVVILAVVFVLSLVPFMRGCRGQTASKTAALPGHKYGLGVLAKGRNPAPEATVKHDSLTWGRDPFVLEEIAPAEVNSPSNLKLMGIIRGANSEPKAIINNDIYPIGSKIGVFTIKKIFKEKVVVSDGEKDYDLNLY